MNFDKIVLKFSAAMGIVLTLASTCACYAVEYNGAVADPQTVTCVSLAALAIIGLDHYSLKRIEMKTDDC